jgi:hypothetical protein
MIMTLMRQWPKSGRQKANGTPFLRNWIPPTESFELGLADLQLADETLQAMQLEPYFVGTPLRVVEIPLNIVESAPPRPWTAVIMATAIPAAMRPYSMAVAPDSSLTKRATEVLIFDTPFESVSQKGPAPSTPVEPDAEASIHRLDTG